MKKRIIFVCSLVLIAALLLPVSSEGRSIFTRYSRLEEVYQLLMDEYYEELDEETLIQGAIDGMLAATGDPYTFYYTPEDWEESESDNTGNYEGVGILVSADKDGMLTVLRVYEPSPAFDEGVQAYDRIIAVNGTPVSATTQEEMDEAVEMIRTSENGATLTLKRKDETLEVTLYKRAITQNRTDWEMIDDKIGYIAIYEFVGNAATLFTQARQELTEAGAQCLILDLRDNPGGMLDVLLEIADEVVPEGTILTITDRAGNSDVYSADSEYWDIPIVLLVNGNSASASEVLTGALRDHGRAVVMGENTFGKGIVQTVHSFPSDGAGVQLTTARYYTPSGQCIHGVGIAPDIEVPADEDDISAANQLEKAIEYCRENY